MVFYGGYLLLFFLKALLRSIFLPCTKGEGLKNLRHTKSSIYMYVIIYITLFNCSRSITFV